ncbi:MAG TPA: polysaccharide deacetylase family protein [Stellaceae bacterium]|nr:polysaccharide deacetylase family protein [Stellaceae bacterium]
MIGKDGERDLVGYGRNPPDPQWPGGAQVALNFVLNIEEGSEYAIEHGDGFSEGSLTEMPESPLPRGARDLAAESMFEYGSRVGVWRILDLFAARDLPMTGFACALALERLPQLAAAWREAGHDICCHGWRWINHWQLSEAEERDHIARAVASLGRTVGEAPSGWYCRYGPSLNTRRLVVEHGGFLYDSDAYNDELPYYLEVAGRPHLVVPYTLSVNDVKFPGGAIGTAADFERLLRDALDLLRAEGVRGGRMMSVGMHARILGHPARAAGLARFLDYACSLRDVWICRRVDIARHWLNVHPPPAG